MNDSNKKILLSIVIPVYNGEKYLEQCLFSIFNIDDENFLKNFEVIIIDDGSTDNSSIIYTKYKKSHKNIKIIKNTNHGVSYSRNCGIIESSGKYITFVDCDDLFDFNWNKIINNDILSKNYDIIFHSKYFLDKTNNKRNKKEILSYILTYNKDNIRISGPYSKLFNRKFILDNKIKFKEDLINGEDMLFNIEALLNSSKQLLIKDSYYIVRHNSFSATNQFNNKIIESEINFNQYIYTIFCKNSIYDYEIIKNITFLTSVRTLSYRISFLKKYSHAKRIFKKIRNNNFFVEKFNGVKNKSISNIYCYLFKYKLYFMLYVLCKIKYINKKVDYFELL